MASSARLKTPTINPLRSPLLWAVAAGLILASAFPKIGIAGAAWFAPGLILFCGLARRASAFRIGYVAGLAHYLASLSWLLKIPVAFFPILGWFALGAYLALFVAAWTWLCCRLCPFELPFAQGGSTGSKTDAQTESHSTNTRLRRIGWALGCAASWVAMEMILARLFSGFPWNFLGASQYRQLPVIQIAAATGIYGVSFMIVWFSASLVGAVAVFVQSSGGARSSKMDLITPFLALAFVISYGVAKCTRPQSAERQLKIALVQPSIPQTLIWDSGKGTNRFQKLLELSERAVATKPDLVIWPEAAVPNLLRYDEATFATITGFARRHHVWMIVGADDAEPKKNPTPGDDADYFNSSFLITPEGKLAGKYNKQHLVIFGEYVPLARWLPFLKWLTPITSGFESGSGPVPFQLTAPRVRTSVLICFEDIFPHWVRSHVEPDTDFLVNITNDGWFGESAAQWQHAASAVFRTVENGLPLVRCANNGLTCWIDSRGGLHDPFLPNTTDAYGEGFKTVEVPILTEGESRTETIYHRYGDWFGWSCVAIAALLLLKCIRLRSAKAREIGASAN